MAQIEETKNSVLPQSFSSDERKELKDEFNRLVAAINALEARVDLLENPA